MEMKRTAGRLCAAGMVAIATIAAVVTGAGAAHAAEESATSVPIAAAAAIDPSVFESVLASRPAPAQDTNVDNAAELDQLTAMVARQQATMDAIAASIAEFNARKESVVGQLR